MRYILLFSIPATAGALFLAKYLIKIVYGNEYLLGTLSFYFLIPLIITTPLIALYSVIFQSKENPKVVSHAILISLVANITFNSLAIFLLKGNPLWMVSGIAAATSLSRILLLGILIFSARNKFGFTVKGLGTKKPLFATTIMAAFLILFNRLVNMNLAWGVTEVILGAMVYFGIMILIKGITKEDLELFKKMIRR